MKDLKQRGLRIFQWFEKRTGLLKPLEEMARHPTPSSAASWWYVFGSAAMVLLIMQVMTGILLALVYSPSASNAYASLQFINHNLRLGWFLRAGRHGPLQQSTSQPHGPQTAPLAAVRTSRTPPRTAETVRENRPLAIPARPG